MLKRTILFAVVLLAIPLACNSAGNKSNDANVMAMPEPLKGMGYRLVWADDFKGQKASPVDVKRWKQWDQGRRRGAVNVKDACLLDGHGNLVITTRNNKGTIETGGVSTKGIFSATHGYFECRCKFQTQEGLWSAFWLMPPNKLGDSNNMATAGVEIDIMEYLALTYKDMALHTIHWGGYDKTVHKSRHEEKKVPGLSEGFHSFGVKWDEAGYVFYTDGKETGRINGPVSGCPEHMILSCEAGTKTNDPGKAAVSWAGDIRKAKLPDTFVVDWVRVWQTPKQQSADLKRRKNTSKTK
jgi:beta-glucanase (GH16 family)